MSDSTTATPKTKSFTRRRFLAANSSSILLSGTMAKAFHDKESEPESVQNKTSAELKAQRLAWAGIKLELPSATLFIDPLISPEVWGNALKQPIIPLESATKQRHVLVTHLHSDHFDVAAAKQLLAESGNVFCHLDSAAAVTSQGLRVRGVQLYEPRLLGDFTITAVPAVDGYNDYQVSWIITAGEKRTIHCGDTLWHGAWWQIGKQYGPFDAAFLPINGAKFFWRKPPSEVPGVMTPEQAVAAGIVLNAKLAIPIHYGVSGADSYEEYPNAEAAFVEIAKKRNLPVEILKHGEWAKWKANV
jgi:L-ascorbate metabolism protein UlaG (beta-lactamase superfamily)